MDEKLLTLERVALVLHEVFARKLYSSSGGGARPRRESDRASLGECVLGEDGEVDSIVFGPGGVVPNRQDFSSTEIAPERLARGIGVRGGDLGAERLEWRARKIQGGAGANAHVEGGQLHGHGVDQSATPFEEEESIVSDFREVADHVLGAIPNAGVAAVAESGSIRKWGISKRGTKQVV